MRFKRSQLKSIFAIIFSILICAFVVYALGTASVTSITLANASWNNETNTTFTFNWTDVNDVDINLADCKLYINHSLNNSDTNLFQNGNLFGGNASVVSNLTTTIFMNRTFDNTTLGENNTAFYWGIECTNLSSSPTTGRTEVRILYHDNIRPKVFNISSSILNNTWINTDIRIEVNVTENGTNGGMYGDLTDCEITNGSQVIASVTVAETNGSRTGTNVNITNSSLADGAYSRLYFRCRDPAGNINSSSNYINVSMDQTVPVFISFNDPTPADGGNQSNNTITFNVTVFDLNLEGINVEFDGANRSINLTMDIMEPPQSVTLIHANVTDSTLYHQNYSYFITAFDKNLDETLNSSRVNITIKGNGTNNASSINWQSIEGAVKYRIYNFSGNASDLILNHTSYFEVSNNSFVHYGQDFDGSGTPPNSVTTNASSFSRCNASRPFTGPVTCNITNSSVGDKRNYLVRVYLNDSAENVVVSDYRNFSVDTRAPRFAILFNWTFASKIVTWKVEINDNTPTDCIAKIHDRNGNYVTNSTGTLGHVGSEYTNCTGTFNASEIDIEGAFNIFYNLTDGTGKTNQTSKAGVMTNLYVGWNFITFPDANKSVLEICDGIADCTRVSVFNNSAGLGGKAFTTYSNSTRSVNNDTEVINARAILVYVTQRSYVVSNDAIPDYTNLSSQWNVSLEIPGWNLVGLLFNTSMNKTLTAITMNGTLEDHTSEGQNMSYVSWLNASAERFYSCKRTLNKCSSTSAVPKDINLKKGYAVWMMPKSQNLSINRSTLQGS